MQINIDLNIKWKDILNNPSIVPQQPSIIKPIQPTEPIKENIIDITDLWYNTFSKGYGKMLLESGKTYSISTIKRQKINGKVIIGTTDKEPAYVWFGKENFKLYIDEGEDSVLFLLDNGAEVVIDNIYPSMRQQDRNVQQMYSINWFTSIQNENATWTALIKNCDTTYLSKNGGFGTGTLYGSTGQNHIGLINYKHAGPMLADLKNPYKNGVLYWTMKNVTTDYAKPSDWSKRAHLTTGIINKSDNILKLTGNVEASCLYNHFFITDKGSNRSFILHLDRYTFMIDTIDSVIDSKTIKLRPSPKANEKVYVKGGRFFFYNREPHVNDRFYIQGKEYVIESKDKTEWDEWTNEWQKGKTPQTYKSPQCRTTETIKLVDGEYLLESYTSSFNLYDTNQNIYLIYKDDMGFRTTATTKFGDWQILQARDGNHIVYNHRSITIWAENVDLNSGLPEGETDPYYRESTNGEGISLGYNIINSKGFDDEFSQKLITTDKPIPDRIKNLI